MKIMCKSEKKSEKKTINKADVILFAIILLAAVGVILFLKLNKKDGNSIEIVGEGKVVKTLPLDKDDEYIYKSSKGTNTIVISDGQAYVTNADCADKICEEYEPISNVGESIICLPHKLVVQVVE